MTEAFKVRELTAAELDAVAGGQSIVEQLEERFPFGEWYGGSFYPNGVPDYIRNPGSTWP